MFRLFAFVLVTSCSVAVAASQTTYPGKDNASKAPSSARIEIRRRDIQFPAGINLKALIQDLALEMDLNVLFDPESRLEMKSVRIQLRNVTLADALNGILLQEGLVYENAGPRTLLISSRFRGTSLPQIGTGLTPLTQQLNQYFGVQGGILINSVSINSPAAKAGLKAGDVIVEIDGQPVRTALGLYNAISSKIGIEIALIVVRDRKPMPVKLRPLKGFE